MLFVYQDGIVSAYHCDITEQGHQQYWGGGSIWDKLSQNIMFKFLHEFLLLNVIVDYISDTCIYVTAHRIPGGPKKDYRRTPDLLS